MFSAEDFAACIDMPQANAILLLAQLQRRSLLQCIDSGERQYQQHTLLAAYATENYYQKMMPGCVSPITSTPLLPIIDKQPVVSRLLGTGDGWHADCTPTTKSSLVLDYWQLLHPEWKQRGHYSSTRQSAAWGHWMLLKLRGMFRCKKPP